MVVMQEMLLDDLLQQNLQVAEKQTVSGSDSQQYKGYSVVFLINSYKMCKKRFGFCC